MTDARQSASSPVAAAIVALAGAQRRARNRHRSPPVCRPQRVDSLAAGEFARDSVASLTIGVVTAQGLVWTKSVRIRRHGRTRLANRQSVYRIGSITKMFTALMLQQLVAHGKIRLTDPVERYYPEIREIRGYSKIAAPDHRAAARDDDVRHRARARAGRSVLDWSGVDVGFDAASPPCRTRTWSSRPARITVLQHRLRHPRRDVRPRRWRAVRAWQKEKLLHRSACATAFEIEPSITAECHARLRHPTTGSIDSGAVRRAKH